MFYIPSEYCVSIKEEYVNPYSLVLFLWTVSLSVRLFFEFLFLKNGIDAYSKIAQLLI